MQPTTDHALPPLHAARSFYVQRRNRTLLLSIVPVPRYDGSEPCHGDEAYTHDTLLEGKQDSEEIRLMKLVCDRCPRLQHCAEYAIAHEKYFFWGGLTADERDDIRASRGQAYIDMTRAPLELVRP